MAEPQSEFVRNLNAIQAAVQKFLKPLGFRKKGRSYNRLTCGELVQVINFQMGQYPIGKSYVIPGFRENYYGKYTVNLGVLLPCVYQTERQQPPNDFVQEYNCTIRERLTCLAFGKDEWFDLRNQTVAQATELSWLARSIWVKFSGTVPNLSRCPLVLYKTRKTTLPKYQSRRFGNRNSCAFRWRFSIVRKTIG